MERHYVFNAPLTFDVNNDITFNEIGEYGGISIKNLMTEDITYSTMISNANKDNDDNSKFITNDFSASDEDYKNKEVFLDDDPETVYKISYRTLKK